MRPDTSMFHQHIQLVDFQDGVDREMWGIYEYDSSYPTWPLIIIGVSAAPKAGCPDRYYFRFDLEGYPGVAPTACPWNIQINDRLENSSWPRGRKFVNNTFNPGWKPNALYAPCDRVAMAGHEGWKDQFPELWWQPTFRITVYLKFLYHLLNSTDYVHS